MFEDYILENVVFEPYEPGHISEWYGQGNTDLLIFHPQHPKEGDVRAFYTVNGEWDIRLIDKDGREHDRLTKPEDITPEFERYVLRDNNLDDEKLILDGEPYTVEWIYNNWFEVFIDVYHNGAWDNQGSEDESALTDDVVGQSREEVEEILKNHIASFLDRESD